MGFLHAKTFETRWGLALAFIDLDDETDVEMLKMQLWAPLVADGSDARVCMKISMPPEASDAAHDAMSEANRSALVEMDAAKFEAAVDKAGIGQALDDACAKATPV